MLFSSTVFIWWFLPAVLLITFFLDRKFHNLFLLLASLAFYGWGEPQFIFLMLISIGMNYVFALGVDRTEGRVKKLIVFLAVLANIGILGYFKYTNFFIETINNVIPEAFRNFGKIALPIGISFYTFQAMSYVIDVYRKECSVQKNPLKLGLYISFFPQLIAGPIVKYHDIALQLEDRAITFHDMAYGIRRFILGLSKKVLIANPLALVADNIFNIRGEHLSPEFAWLGLFCYTFQIYYDFSGYSDMAIGLGRMFGFKFLENFNYPYLSSSIREFWTRWHISLSTWFKEYLYFPLGGNRRGSLLTCRNLLIVFFVTGIWHGASWTFVVWGLFHGFFMLLERVFLKKLPETKAVQILLHVYALFVVMTAWVFFRAETIPEAFSYLKALFIPHRSPYNFSACCDWTTFLFLGLAILFCGPVQMLFPKFKHSLFQEEKTRIWELILLPLLLLLSLVFLVANTYNPFIYFRF